MAPFRVPDGVSLAPIDRETGEPSVIGRPGVILEAFKPGTEPQRGQTDAEETLSFGANALGVISLRARKTMQTTMMMTRTHWAGFTSAQPRRFTR
ncbi:MAG: hypothetical protein JKP95_01150 [Oceanicaulis sp.]|nr:hypothetical protein [Oceanicaulis sp.]